MSVYLSCKFDKDIYLHMYAPIEPTCQFISLPNVPNPSSPSVLPHTKKILSSLQDRGMSCHIQKILSSLQDRGSIKKEHIQTKQKVGTSSSNRPLSIDNNWEHPVDTKTIPFLLPR
uniref:Uncharacterized protein n=1 Tax=Cacopsylla melanoneura TaxID=428564 RepID=A0A8D9E5T4_9HEMI